jgi:hypothetical protein
MGAGMGRGDDQLRRLNDGRVDYRDRSSMQRYRDLVESDGLLPNPSPEDHP